MASMFGFIKDIAKKAAQQVNAATATPAAIIPIGDKRVQMMEKLGEGGFAFVYKVEDVDTGQTYALKRMLAQDEENKSIAEKEITVMKKLQGHPNIIGFTGACNSAVVSLCFRVHHHITSHHILFLFLFLFLFCRRDVPTEGTTRMRSIEYFILMEFCPGGSLIDLIQKRDKVKLPEKQIYQTFVQIVKAVHHMHAQTPPIAHRDLKLENVLIASDGVTLKLCDFGSTTTLARSYTTKEEICFEEEKISKYSTSMYRAPEMADLYKREVISEKVDVWALGCILYTLAFFIQPFQEGGNLQIISGNYDVPEVHPFSKYVTALIKRLLTVSPKKRPDTATVLELCSQWEKFLTSGKSATSPSASATTATKKSKDTLDTANNNTSTTRRSSQDKEHKTKHKHKQSAIPQPVAVNPDFATDWNPFPDPSSSFSPASASGSISSSSSQHSHHSSHSHSNSNSHFVTSPVSPSPSPSGGFDPHFQSQSQSQSLAHFHAHHSSSGSNVAQLFDASAFEMPVSPSPHSLALSPNNGSAIPATSTSSFSSSSSLSSPSAAGPVSAPVPTSAHPVVSPSRALGAPGINPNWAAFTPPVAAPPVAQATSNNNDSDDVWSSFATDTSAAISAAASSSHIHTAPPADEFSSFDWSGFSPPGKNESKDQGQGEGEDERRRDGTQQYKQLVKKKKVVSREVSPSKPKSKTKSKRRGSTSTSTNDAPPPASDNEDEQD